MRDLINKKGESFSNIFDKERVMYHFAEFEKHYNIFLKILKRI